MADITDAFAKAMEAAGVRSLRQLAIAANIPYGTVRGFAHGRNIPSADTAVKIARVLGVTVDLLLGLPPQTPGSSTLVAGPPVRLESPSPPRGGVGIGPAMPLGTVEEQRAARPTEWRGVDPGKVKGNYRTLDYGRELPEEESREEAMVEEFRQVWRGADSRDRWTIRGMLEEIRERAEARKL